VCIHREFSHESVGEKILKIGPHLPKLLSNIKGYTFFGTLCIYLSVTSFTCDKMTSRTCSSNRGFD